MRITVYYTDGSTNAIPEGAEEDSPESGRLSLDEMYKHIGCETVEHLELQENVHMWFDEEGKLKNLPINHPATGLFKEAFPETEDVIVGNAIVVDLREE